MSHLFRNLPVRTSMATGLALLVAALAPPAFAGDSEGGNGKSTIVFVCLHGSVKSQMAAAHFNRIARERGLPLTAVSRGIEVDASIPTRIRDGLNLDGLAPLDDIRVGLTAEEAARATKVVAFDAVPEERRGASEVTYWSDVPAATKDYVAAREAIVGHIESLVPTLATTAPATSLTGVVASVDERNDSISIRLQSAATGETTEDFKVQDGLVFDAVRCGDRIEFTVLVIDGAKTIVQIRKE